MKRFLLVFLSLTAALASVEILTARAPSRAAAKGMVALVGGVAGYERSGDTLRLGEKSIGVDPECSALPYGLLAVFAVLAWPASWKRRLAGAGAALAVVILLDLVRLVVLLNLHGTSAYSVAHGLAGAVFAGVLLGGWLLWTRYCGSPISCDLRHPVVGMALLGAVFAGMTGLLSAQGPPPPPPGPKIPLGGVEWVALGIAGSVWMKMRRQERETEK